MGRLTRDWCRQAARITCFSTARVLCAFVGSVLALTGATGAHAQTANADGSYTVPPGWALRPAGVDPGERFRLLFVTSTGHRDGNSGQARHYHDVVKSNANGGHSAIRPYGSHFRALISTKAGHIARNQTNTRSSDLGAEIHWLNGDKVADSYSDFYDGTWDSHAFRFPSGSRSTSSGNSGFNGTVSTGSNQDGTRHSTQAMAMGATHRVGRLTSIFNRSTNPISHENQSGGQHVALYGLSPVFVTAQPLIIAQSGGSTRVSENGQTTDSYTINLGVEPTHDVTVTLNVPATAARLSGNGTDASAAGMSRRVLLFRTNNWRNTRTITVTGVNDDIDNASDARNVIIRHGTTSADPNYNIGDKFDLSVTVSDDDTAGVTINASDPLTMSEIEGQGSYTLVLDTQPLRNVTITATSGDGDAAKVDGPDSATAFSNSDTVTFTTTNWNIRRR